MKDVTLERPSSHQRTVTKLPASATDSHLFGLATRRKRWGLSWKGWLVIGHLVIAMAVWLTYASYPFLAVTNREKADTLVVEGWVHQYAIRTAVNEFGAGHYDRVFTTGGPVAGMGGYTNDYNTSATQGAVRLQAEGLTPDVIQAVPARISDRDRTYSSARALRDWFSNHHSSVHAINVLTENVHARRTRLLFETALGQRTAVGIIAVGNPDYDANHWWRYSEGVRDLISEGIAYVYAKFFFCPRKHMGWPSHLYGQKQSNPDSIHVSY